MNGTLVAQEQTILHFADLNSNREIPSSTLSVRMLRIGSVQDTYSDGLHFLIETSMYFLLAEKQINLD